MELHVHVEEVAERLARDLTNRALCDCRKDGIAELTKPSSADTGKTICLSAKN